MATRDGKKHHGRQQKSKDSGSKIWVAAVVMCLIAIIAALSVNSIDSLLPKKGPQTSKLRATEKASKLRAAPEARIAEKKQTSLESRPGKQADGVVAKKRQPKQKNRDEVAMTEYHLVGANHTLRMKQNWWHSHESSAGATTLGQPAPTWEAAFVAADYLTRHQDPWSPTKLGVLRAAESESLWDWSKTLVVVLGVEIGLSTSAVALRGSMVVAADASIRLLEAARSNVWDNVPQERRQVALRKALWGAPVQLQDIADRRFADLVVLTHAQCSTLGEGPLLQTALSIIGSRTLLLIAFDGSECDELVKNLSNFELARVDPSKLHPDFSDQVSLLALKLKPKQEED